MYNAIIRKVPGKVPDDDISDEMIGRVFLNTLTPIPDRWTVLFRGSPLNHATTDIGKLMCTSKDPLTIYMGPWDPKWIITVNVQLGLGKSFGIKIRKDATIGTLKSQIDKLGVVTWRDHELTYPSFLVPIEDDRKVLEDYKIGDQSIIRVVNKSYLEQHIASANNKMEIIVKTLTGEEIIFLVTPNYKVEKVKDIIYCLKGIHPFQQRLLFEWRQLEDYKTLLEYNVSNESTLHLVLRLRGGGFSGNLVTQDVEATQVSGMSAGSAEFHWQGYTSGMNLYGICNNKHCESRKNGKVQEVVYQAKYGQIFLTPERMTFDCKACLNSVCLISQFVVSKGRALFRFKKSGVGQEVKHVVLESLGSTDEYKTFDDKGGNAKYDFIEIMTVRVHESFYYCVRCSCVDNTKIEKSEEVILACGHVYHDKCTPHGNEKRCMVCDAKLIESSHIHNLL